MRNFPFSVLNRPIDVSREFVKLENALFAADRVAAFDPRAGAGELVWKRYSRKPRLAFGEVTVPYEAASPWEFPGGAYSKEPHLPFRLDFLTDRTIRLRVETKPLQTRESPSLMLASATLPEATWEIDEKPSSVTYSSPAGSVEVEFDPWRVVIRDALGRLLTSTYDFDQNKSLLNSDHTPFSFVRKTGDLGVHMAASFTLAHDEKIYGCGESYTRLNKRGQRLTIMVNDPHGAQSQEMYKAIPFFLSSRGYGMFVHTSAPLTFDFGHAYDGGNVLYSGDDCLDLFIFLGEPKDILEEYTALTGRSPVPPLWSFGLWMSRITYKSEAETRAVANELRRRQIPCDVIHLDTGWFEEDWRCDYAFSKERFPDPVKMLSDLKQQGFRVSVWQLPYFTPGNRLYAEAVDKGYVVRGPGGGPATEDAVIDFSNPDAVRWYQSLLTPLLKAGVAAIKVDFGEAAPTHGLYASGRTGFFEHNLYPLRYNQAAFDVTRQVTGDNIIWARSAWAGSQRYPLHWGGDAENTYSSMAASLRAGLSIGLCGFTFWSHDIGGFVVKTPEELYRRWLAFGMLTSHSRLHGAPPKEPWEYSEAFVEEFRNTVELKYRLMPYAYAQAVLASQKGHPMMRPLFFEFPDDPTSWHIEDQYMFGADLLVAPLFDETQERQVYLPPGRWIDYQTGHLYDGSSWRVIAAGEVPIIALVKGGSVVPRIQVAQCADDMDFSEIELAVFLAGSDRARGYVCLPGAERVEELVVENGPSGLRLVDDPFGGDVTWRVRPG